jgi:hypothetical protein
MIQFRELTWRFAVANAYLLNRPEFGTHVTPTFPLEVTLWAEHEGSPRFAKFDIQKHVEILVYLLRDLNG